MKPNITPPGLTPKPQPRRRFPTPRLQPVAALLASCMAVHVLAAQAPPATETVVVTATRHAMLAMDAPAAMSAVTAQELQARGADDLLDALRGETGVSLQGRSIPGARPAAGPHRTAASSPTMQACPGSMPGGAS